VVRTVADCEIVAVLVEPEVADVAVAAVAAVAAAETARYVVVLVSGSLRA
jgi:hypothetical protein